MATTISHKRLTNISDFIRLFPSEKACKNFLIKIRWQGKPTCPYCGCTESFNRKDGRFSCKHCRNAYSILVGTIFQNTKIPLLKWFMAIYLVANHKKGISSKRLSEVLNITQKTAWFLMHKIRIVLRNTDDNFPDVVIGEIVNLIGKKGTHYMARIPKSPIKLHPKIDKFVEKFSRIYNDRYINLQSLIQSEMPMYKIEDPFPFDSQRVPTNTPRLIVNGLWQKLKRTIAGVYHYVSAALFHRYVYEVLFRHKNRNKKGLSCFEKILNRINMVITYRVVRPR